MNVASADFASYPWAFYGYQGDLGSFYWALPIYATFNVTERPTTDW